MMNKARLDNKWFWLITAVYAFLVLYGLDLSQLWNDEAITGFLANNCLKFGYPRAFDGLNWTDPREAARFGLGPGLAWVTHPWLQYYLAAFSIKFLGVTPFAARLPFAIFGFLSLFPFFALSKSLFNNNRTSLFSSLFLITCVSFLLHMRQCRYYSLVAFFSLTLLAAYFWMIAKPKLLLPKACFLLSAMLLFHSNHGVFIPILGGLCFFHYFFNRQALSMKTIAVFALFIAAFSIPWFILSHQSNEEQSLLFSWKLLQKNSEFQFRIINKYLMPLLFYVGCFGLSMFSQRARSFFQFPLTDKEKRALAFFAIYFAIHAIFFCFVKVRTIRYFIHLVPILALLQGFIVSKWYDRHKVFAIVILLLSISSNILSRPSAPRSYFLEYLYEITHDYDGPVEAIVNYLKENARPGERVKITYGDAQVMFYLPQLALLNDYFYAETSFPEFIVNRKYWRREEELKMINKKQGLKAAIAYWHEIEARYDKITLPAIDIIWENRPDDLEYHKFRTVTEGDPVVIYRRRDTSVPAHDG